MNIYIEMKRAAMAHYSKTALMLMEDSGETVMYTYAESLRYINDFADRLTGIGVKAGDRIGIAAESRPEWNFAFMACAKLEATPVLMDYSLPASELRELARKAQLCCLLVSDKSYENLGSCGSIPTLNICRGLEFTPGSPTVLDRSGMKGDKNIGVIIFSSGTTKTASGIMHTHDSQINSCRMVCRCNGITDSERYLGILPNSHIYGLFAQVLAPMLTGGTVCFLSSLNGRSLSMGFSEFSPTILPAVPKVYELLKTQIMKTVNESRIASAVFDRLFPVCLKSRKVFGINMGKGVFKKIHKALGGKMKIMCSAGSPMSRDTFEFFYATGFNIVNNYGATETSIPTIGTYRKHVPTDSCGRAYPDIKMKIDRSGEMLIRSPYLMIGYFNDPAATAEAFTDDGWFRTGDLAKFDKHKNVVILGRCKENIVLSTGKKAAPDDIEAAYKHIDIIDELVVCGVPVEDGSFDEVHAFAVCPQPLREQAEKQLRETSDSLSQAMRLSGIHFVDAIPRTAIGKPKRYLLKKMVMEDSFDTLDANTPEQVDSADIPQLTRNAVAKIANVSPSQVKMSSRIFHDFTIDSLSAIELAIEIEKFSGVKVDEEMDKDITVGRLVSLIQNPNRIKRSSVRSMLYPLNKTKIDFRIYRFYRNLVRFLYEVEVTGEENLPEENGYIICANHVSNFDYLFLTTNFRYDRFARFCCMAKKELFKNNLLNKLVIRIGGMVPVDRGGQVTDAMASLRKKLSEKWGVLVHPEGTRSKTGEMGEFKNGAALLAIETATPIVPAYIKGGHEIFPPDKTLPHLFNWKRLSKYKVRVLYGKPIYPDSCNADELTARVREAVLALKAEADSESGGIREMIRAKIRSVKKQ